MSDGTIHAIVHATTGYGPLQTVAFYRDVLGFEVDTLWPEEESTFAAFTCGEITLAFYKAEPPLDFRGQIVLDAEDVQGLHDSIKDRVKIAWGPEVYHYEAREFAIEDPGGHTIIFSEYTTDPPTCEG